MYSLLGLFLLVLIVSPSFEINFSKHAGDEKNDIGQGPSLERRRRGLYPGGQEYAFFLHYFQAINKADQFKNSISAGNANWTKAFDTTYNVGYFKAIDKVTAYYALPANNVTRGNAILEIGAIITFRESYKGGDLDHAHRNVVNKWRHVKDDLMILQHQQQN